MEGIQQTDVKKSRYESAKQPLVRYVKNPLVKYTKMQVVFAVLVLAFVALLMFTPMFSINLLDVDDSTGIETLSKVQEAIEAAYYNAADSALESGVITATDYSALISTGSLTDLSLTDLLNSVLLVSYLDYGDLVVSLSIFDELTIMFSSFGTMFDATSSFSMVGIIFQILALLVFVRVVVVAVFLLVKNLTRSCYTMSKYSIYNYTLNGYGENVIAEIMYRPVSQSEKFNKAISNPLCLSLVAIVLEIICLIMDGLINSSVVELVKEGELEAESVTSYMSYVTGANLWLAVVLIVAALAVGLFVYTQNLKSGMKERIAVMESELSKES